MGKSENLIDEAFKLFCALSAEEKIIYLERLCALANKQVLAPVPQQKVC